MPRSTITRQDAPPPGSWWSTPWFAVLISLTLAVPLLQPAVAPLIDIYGHLARFAIDARIDSSPYFHHWFAVQWRLSGNLGMDLLVAAAEPLLDVVETTKIALIAAAVMTAAGMLAVAKEAHGRIPPSAFFAIPLTFGMPF
jgi:predicted metal-binding membrane protein